MAVYDTYGPSIQVSRAPKRFVAGLARATEIAALGILIAGFVCFVGIVGTSIYLLS